MKKKKHIILILSGILFLLGVLLILVGMILGVDYDELTISSHSVTTQTVSHTIETTASDDPSTVHKLDFDLFAGNIIIKSGDDFSVSGGKLSKNVIEDGVWKVKTSKHKKLSELIRHTFTSSDTHTGTITITIPDSAALTEVHLELSAGNVKINTLKADTIKLGVSAASTKADTIQAKNVSLDVAAGSMTIDQFTINDKASIDCSAGDIKLGSKDNAAKNVCNNLKADCSAGSLDLYGKLTGSSDLQVHMGDITLGLAGAKNNYNFNSASATMGDIRYKNEGTTTDTTVYGDVSLDCTMGNIKVTFYS